jgi:large subunit ribosomal protein L10
MNLAMFVHYVTDRTIEPLIVQAEQRALNVAMASGILTKKTAELLLQKAHGQMLSLSSRIPDALDDELKAKLTTRKKREPEEKPDEGKEKKKEEKEVSEEEAASGLGALFG